MIYHPLGQAEPVLHGSHAQGAIRPAPRQLPSSGQPVDRSFISQKFLPRTHTNRFFVTHNETGSVRISEASSFYAITANPLFSYQGWKNMFLISSDCLLILNSCSAHGGDGYALSVTHRYPCVCLAGVAAACRAGHPDTQLFSVLAACGNHQELKEFLMAGPAPRLLIKWFGRWLEHQNFKNLSLSYTAIKKITALIT